MNVVDISRWQFGITTVYHFIFVPLTIGLAPLIAVMKRCGSSPITPPGIASPNSSANCS